MDTEQSSLEVFSSGELKHENKEQCRCSLPIRNEFEFNSVYFDRGINSR